LSGLSGVPKVWVSRDQADLLLRELFDLQEGSGTGAQSSLPRAIVMVGITEKALIGLMKVCKKTVMKQSLWATLTPTSENWTLKQLLSELAAEHRAMQIRTRK
jgi:hypothetical protein